MEIDHLTSVLKEITRLAETLTSGNVSHKKAQIMALSKTTAYLLENPPNIPKILPLEGKYYGTRVSIIGDDKPDITIWTRLGDQRPSEREIQPDPSHYESRGDYEIAQIIVKALEEFAKDKKRR